MQHSGTMAKSNGSPAPMQVVNDLRVRALQAKGGFMAIGASVYMGFLEMQAAKEGIELNATEKTRLRQVMNAHLTAEDADRVAFIERALKSIQQKAA